MTASLDVFFDLGEYDDYPDLDVFRVGDSDVRVKKDPGNYCELSLNGNVFVTNYLELEFSGGGWTASAMFDVSVTPETIGDIRIAVAGGLAKLRLGEYEFHSDEFFNDALFDDNFFKKNHGTFASYKEYRDSSDNQ